MVDFERILIAYEGALARMAQDMAGTLEPSPEERHHLGLLDELLHSVVRTYGGHYLRVSSDLDTSTSVMYALTQGPERILDVPLRSLVDAGTLSVWQARFLNKLLGAKRSLLVTGSVKSGKSTLLNAIVQLIPLDERVVAVERGEELPSLARRSFTMRLAAAGEESSLLPSLKKAAEMRPSWIVPSPLLPADLSVFLDVQRDRLAALGTLELTEPDTELSAWAAADPDLLREVERVRPFVAHVERDRLGTPRLTRILELSVTAGVLSLQEFAEE